MRVWVEDNSYGGIYIYRVVVDGKMFDEFVLRNGHPLTWAQQSEVADMYRESLDGYRLGGVE